MVGFHQLQTGDLHIQVHAFLDTGVTGTQSLDLRKGEGCFVHIVAASHRRFGSHDLADEFLLVLHGLPQESVERPLGHIAVHMNKGVLVALALDTSFSLLQICESVFADIEKHSSRLYGFTQF